MLVLTRKVGEKIHIGDDIVVVVVRLMDGSVRLGIEAPPHTTIVRQEVIGKEEASPINGELLVRGSPK